MSNLNTKLLALIGIIVIGISAFAVLLLSNLGNNSDGMIPTTNSEEEALQIISAELWYNPSTNRAYSALLLINEKNVTAIIQKITIKGLLCNWENVYYCITEIGSVSKVNQIEKELTGTTQEISVDGKKLIFTQATDGLKVEGFKALVVYIKNSDELDASALSEGNITAAVFTQKRVYLEEVSVKTEIPFIVFEDMEKLTIINVAFNKDANGIISQITIMVKNTGVISVTIDEIYINDVRMTPYSSLKTVDLTVDANLAGSITINVDATAPINISPGGMYQFKLMSSKGNVLVYTATAPI